MTGADLRERRKKLGMSQSSLAKHWNVIQATISNWENETHKIQHPEILDDALKFLESQREK